MSDAQFKQSFMLNKNKIMTAIEKYSGTYSLNEDATNRFINGQLSSIRKQAARDLIDNTHYITLKEISEIVETLIIQVYDKIGQLGPEDNIYFFTGPKDKSYYFMSILALFYIRSHGLRDPIFIDRLSTEWLDQIGSNPLIYLDDVSYSGSQMQQTLNQLYNLDLDYELNIYVLLVALNTCSLSKLTKVINDETQQSHPTPYKILYLPDRLYPTIIESIGIERYFMLQLFFSPYTPTCVSIYLDNKMADDLSTFKRALSFGPIVPSSYNFNKIIGALRHWSPLEDLPKEIQNHLYSDFNEAIIAKEAANPKYKHKPFTNEPNINSYYYETIIEPDLIVQDRIKFFPAIRSCASDAKLAVIIANPEIIHMDYALFMEPQGGINDEDEESLCSSGEEAQMYYLDLAEKPENIMQLNALISSIDCPVSWYKSGIFMMAGTKRKKRRNQTKRKRFLF